MIAIPNMDKPKVCHECIAFSYEQGDYEPDVYCEITKEELFDATSIPNDCPIIEIDDDWFKKTTDAYVLQQIRYGEGRNDEPDTERD